MNVTYMNSDYLREPWNRTVMDNAIGFFGLAILAAGILVVFLVFKREGIF